MSYHWTHRLLALVLNFILLPEQLLHVNCHIAPSATYSITKIHATYESDYRAIPTVQVGIYLSDTDNVLYSQILVPPAEDSTSGKKTRNQFMNKNAEEAVKNINDVIGLAVVKADFNVTDQAVIDKFMLEFNGTDSKEKFGATATIGVSMAVCKNAAFFKGIPLYQYIAELAGNKELILPVPAFSVIKGGKLAENSLAMQEYMILPVGAKSFRDAMIMSAEVYDYMENIIVNRSVLAGAPLDDETDFTSKIKDDKEAFELIKEAIALAGHEGKVKIYLDAAASEFYKDGAYDLDFKSGKKSDPSTYLKPEKLADVYCSFMKEYPLVTIEDPFERNDLQTWRQLTSCGDIQVVADDLKFKNPKEVQEAIDKKAANCLLLKMTQIGTITESIEAFTLAKNNGWSTLVPLTSDDTEDNAFMAELAIGLGLGQIKSIAPCRRERTCRYNHILDIERVANVRYAGENFRNP